MSRRKERLTRETRRQVALRNVFEEDVVQMTNGVVSKGRKKYLKHDTYLLEKAFIRWFQRHADLRNNPGAAASSFRKSLPENLKKYSSEITKPVLGRLLHFYEKPFSADATRIVESKVFVPYKKLPKDAGTPQEYAVVHFDAVPFPGQFMGVKYRNEPDFSFMHNWGRRNEFNAFCSDHAPFNMRLWP